jgi:hypothetical protein
LAGCGLGGFLRHGPPLDQACCFKPTIKRGGEAMDRWEYEIYQWLGGVSPDQIRGELNRRSTEGWELVGIHPSAPGGAMLFLKRAKQSPSPGSFEHIT